jgi:integrase
MAFNTSNWHIEQEKILSRKDASSVLAIAKKTRFEDYVLLAVSANTGLRICEVLHLTGANIKKNALVITRRKKKRLLPETVPITPDLCKLLESMKAKLNAPEGWLWPGGCTPCKRGPGDGLLCEGGHISKREVQRRWAFYLDELGLFQKGRGIHSLRHYAVTEFYRVHRDIRAAQVFAGHSSSVITETYAHVVDMEEKVNAIKPVL